MHYTGCRPGRRCKQWRICDACARIRQAQIADVADAGAATAPRVTYAIVRTYDAHSISSEREKFVARLAEISEGGLWTIETGERTGGLHINVIASTLDGLAASELAACWPIGSSADFWATDVPRHDARRVAAYCSKRKAMPDPEYYGGRLYGSWGTWKRPLAALVESPDASPIAAAAALDTMIQAAVPPAPTFERADADASEIRRRLKTLFAAHLGELKLHGMGYVPGYGVVTLEEARKMGAID